MFAKFLDEWNFRIFTKRKEIMGGGNSNHLNSLPLYCTSTKNNNNNGYRKNSLFFRFWSNYIIRSFCKSNKSKKKSCYLCVTQSHQQTSTYYTTYWARNWKKIVYFANFSITWKTVEMQKKILKKYPQHYFGESISGLLWNRAAAVKMVLLVYM